MLTSTTPTAHEIAAVLIAQHSNRGGGRAVVVNNFDVEVAQVIGTITSDKYDHKWIAVDDVRAYIANQGLDLTGKDLGLTYTYKLREGVRVAVDRVRVLTNEGVKTTSKVLMTNRAIDQESLDVAVSMGLLETFRPPRKRTDQYRIASK